MSQHPRLHRALLAVCTAALAVASGAASAEPTFTVTEGVVPGTTLNSVTADRITFGYNAKIIQTVVGSSLAGADDPFIENGFLNKASFELGAGNAQSTFLNAAGTTGYKIYGVFTITGEADPFGAAGILATFQTGTLTLYVDPNSDTTLGFDVGNNVTVAGDTEDIKLANLSLTEGQAHVFDTLAKGDFNSLLNFALTPFGSTFFTDPNPFYGIENFGGNTQTITGITNPNASFVASATGAGVELFRVVPEPATLSLVGLALLGVGGLTRRQKKIP